MSTFLKVRKCVKKLRKRPKLQLQALQLCNCILQTWNHIQFSIIQHINHRNISPYCFITLNLHCGTFVLEHAEQKDSCYTVHTHQRCVLSLLHGWGECSCPPPAEELRAFPSLPTGEPPGPMRKRHRGGALPPATPLSSITLHVGQPQAAHRSHQHHRILLLLLPHATHFRHLTCKMDNLELILARSLTAEGLYKAHIPE